MFKIDGEDSGMTKKDFVLQLLRPIASAETEEEMKIRMDMLRSTDVWNDSEKLRNWLETTWFPCCKVIYFNIISLHILQD